MADVEGRLYVLRIYQVFFGGVTDQQCQARDVGHGMDFPNALGAKPVLPDSGLGITRAPAMLTCVVFTFPWIIGIPLDGGFVLGLLAYAQEG